MEETRELALQQGMTLTLDMDNGAGLPDALYLDGTRLRQVLINLLANACRHSQGRRIVLSARGTAARRPGLVSLEITVRDDGIGIPEPDRERIFQPFEQGAGSSSNGLGLGLAICRQLMDLMRGEIRLVPEEEGTCFRLLLEVEAVDLPAQADTRAAPATPALATPMRHARGREESSMANLARPSGGQLAALRQAAEEGRVSDIEDWVRDIQQAEPEAAEFALRVLTALRRLDLPAIMGMTD